MLLIHSRLWICLISSPDSGRGATRNSFSKPENRRIIQDDTSKRDFSIRFQGDRYLLVLDGKVQQDATYMLDPGHEPRWIDWIASIRDKTVTLLGIYEFPDPTGLQVLKKCRVSGRRHFCHPTSFQGRGCENGRSTEDPASGS